MKSVVGLAAVALALVSVTPGFAGTGAENEATYFKACIGGYLQARPGSAVEAAKGCEDPETRPADSYASLDACIAGAQKKRQDAAAGVEKCKTQYKPDGTPKY